MLNNIKTMTIENNIVNVCYSTKNHAYGIHDILPSATLTQFSKMRQICATFIIQNV